MQLLEKEGLLSPFPMSNRRHEEGAWECLDGNTSDVLAWCTGGAARGSAPQSLVLMPSIPTQGPPSAFPIVFAQSGSGHGGGSGDTPGVQAPGRLRHSRARGGARRRSSGGSRQWRQQQWKRGGRVGGSRASGGGGGRWSWSCGAERVRAPSSPSRECSAVLRESRGPQCTVLVVHGVRG
mgnify:CR=1 FL=1